jgi:hypothetical protein
MNRQRKDSEFALIHTTYHTTLNQCINIDLIPLYFDEYDPIKKMNTETGSFYYRIRYVINNTKIEHSIYQTGVIYESCNLDKGNHHERIYLNMTLVRLSRFCPDVKITKRQCISLYKEKRFKKELNLCLFSLKWHYDKKCHLLKSDKNNVYIGCLFKPTPYTTFIISKRLIIIHMVGIQNVHDRQKWLKMERMINGLIKRYTNNTPFKVMNELRLKPYF